MTIKIEDNTSDETLEPDHNELWFLNGHYYLMIINNNDLVPLCLNHKGVAPLLNHGTTLKEIEEQGEFLTDEPVISYTRGK